MLGVNQSLTNIRKKIAPNDNSAQIADNNLAAQKLLSDQKAAADLQEQTKLAGSAYGSLGGQNIQSTTNKSGKKSILGSF